MPSIEIEVKFYIKKYENIIKKVETYAGKTKSSGFETNTLFDYPDRRLSNNQEILRLRKYNGETILTHKKKINDKKKDFKKMKETETRIESYDEFLRILYKLGLKKIQIYEKYRDIYTIDNLEICIDRLPFGNFMELEGSEELIKKMALSLKLDWSKRILPSYRTIFEKIKKEYHLNFQDISFENFQNLYPDIKKIVDSL